MKKIIRNVVLASLIMFNVPVLACNDIPVYETEEFIITHVSNGEYFGKSLISDNGIYFTNGEIREGDIIENGSIILGVFDPSNDYEIVNVELAGKHLE